MDGPGQENQRNGKQLMVNKQVFPFVKGDVVQVKNSNFGVIGKCIGQIKIETLIDENGNETEKVFYKIAVDIECKYLLQTQFCGHMMEWHPVSDLQPLISEG